MLSCCERAEVVSSKGSARAGAAGVGVSHTETRTFAWSATNSAIAAFRASPFSEESLPCEATCSRISFTFNFVNFASIKPRAPSLAAQPAQRHSQDTSGERKKLSPVRAISGRSSAKVSNFDCSNSRRAQTVLQSHSSRATVAVAAAGLELCSLSASRAPLAT